MANTPSSQSEDRTLVRLEGVSKEYKVGDATVYALRDVSLDIPEGQFAVLLGPSGSGKTTLLNMIGGLDAPTRGRMWVSGSEITGMDESSLTMYRRNSVGFVFQFFNLVPSLTAGENVEMVAELTGNKRNAIPALQSVGLGERIGNFPAQLSGGEQQRVAIARALAKGPSILLGDEPTGDLDYETGKMILALMRNINRSENATMLIVTHNAAISRMADRVIRMRSGEIVEDTLNRNPISPEDLEW
ncbi:MAG: ABC transporter ATP-binding protein [Chloroflexi bacterium]|nr:ABC transporter ATP-binding protein [Chloroflexota bacterium]